MGAPQGIARFFIGWGIKYLVLLVVCLFFVGVPQDRIGLLMLGVLIATILGEVLSRLITGGM